MASAYDVLLDLGSGTGSFSRLIAQQSPVDWNLLRTQDMRILFPDARVHVEKLAGLPKSIIAYRRASS